VKQTAGLKGKGRTLCFICHEVVCPADNNALNTTDEYLIDYRRILQTRIAKTEMVK